MNEPMIFLLSYYVDHKQKVTIYTKD